MFLYKTTDIKKRRKRRQNRSLQRDQESHIGLPAFPGNNREKKKKDKKTDGLIEFFFFCNYGNNLNRCLRKGKHGSID